MRRHAKAPSAGSIEGSGRRRSLIGLLAILALALCALGSGASAASAAPAASLDSISAVTETSVHLTGTVEAAEETYWRFDYSTDGVNWVEGGGPSAAGGPIPESETTQSTTVEGEFKGLEPNTKYFVRLAFIVVSANQFYYSPTPKFTTAPTPGLASPTVISINNAAGVSFTTAKASGEIEHPAGDDPALDTRCAFEYVSDAQFAIDGFQSALPVVCDPPNPLIAPGASVATANLTGLMAATTYHLRLAAENSGGTDVKDAAATFTTDAATAPGLTLDPATSVSYANAHIQGTIDPEGGNVDANAGPLPIAWELQINREGSGWKSAEGGVIAAEGDPVPALGSDPIAVTADLANLQSGSKYEFRLQAAYAGLETTTSLGEFETLPVAPPTVLSIDDASEVAYTTAAAHGKIERPAGDDPAFHVNCNFEYVTAAQFAANGFKDATRALCDPPNPIEAPGEADVTAKLSGLAPATTYHLRLAADNLGGTATKAAAGTFTTLGPVSAPVVEISPPSLLTATNAHFTGKVTAGGEDPVFDSSCAFEYISEEDYGPRAEVQKLMIKAAAGTFKLSLAGQVTAPIAFDATAGQVDSALEALPAIGPGGVIVSGGPGNPTGSTPYTLTFPGVNVDLVSLDASALTLLGKAQVTTLVPGFGKDEVQKLTVAASSGTYTLDFEGEETDPIAFNANAATVQSALDGLATIGGANIAVSGGPGSPSGASPYTITFVGALGNTNVPQIGSDSSSLVGPGGSGETETASEGHTEGFEGAQGRECKPTATITGTTPTDVEADAENTELGIRLQPNTTYHLRLRAENQGGSGIDTTDFTTLPASPIISATNVSEITATSATLSAQINPAGAATTYHFEYLTLDAFEKAGETFTGATSTPESASIGADNQNHEASAGISGLSPDTAYRFRVVATNAQSEPGGTPGPVAPLRTAGGTPPAESCPNESLRAENNSLALPDCRAYELVSPDLNHASLGSQPFGQALPSGNSMAYKSIDSPQNTKFGSVNNFVVADRDPVNGWSGTALGFPAKGPTAGFFAYVSTSVSPDLTAALVTSDQGPDGPPSNPGMHIWVARSDGTTDQVTKYGNPFFDGLDLYQSFAGLAAYYDYRSVFFKPGVAQLPDDDPAPGGSTYWWADGDLRLLGILPDGNPAPFGSDLPPETLLPPVSEDGTRVLFRAAGDPALYLRVGDTPGVEVSKSQRTVDPDPSPYPDAISGVGGILPDASAVLFTSRNELTDDAYTGRTPGGERNHAGNDLYSYDVASGELTDLTVDTKPADAATGANVSLVGASADGSTIYFRATGNLAPGGSSGQPSLYRYRDGEIEFVSRADGLDRSRISEDGDAIAFTSTVSLTGYDNANPVTGMPQPEVFLARPGAPLECASCRPDGSRPTGGASTADLALSGGRSVSNDGERVFFGSTEALVPGASGDQPKVYEYADGEIALISAADDDSPARFLDATPSGDDVFFSTHDELVENPNGGDYAVYDARVDGGFPHPERVQCDGSSCRGAATSPPTPTPASSRTFEGPGDTPGISVAKKLTIKGSHASLRVRVPGKGKLTASGKGLKTTRLSVNTAKTATLQLSLSGAAKQKLRKGNVVHSKATVTFVDAAGGRSRATVALTFKPASEKGK